MSHEGELLSSDSSERSDNNDEDDYGTGAKDNNCCVNGNGDGDRYGDGDGTGDRNTGTRGSSV